MKTILLLFLPLLMIITTCSTNDDATDMEKSKEEVWQTVLAHNKAWAELENLDEQMKYVHKDIVFVGPPYKNTISGIDAYRKNYEEWIDHATVHSTKESAPEIIILNNGKTAIVTYNGEMSFEYDNQSVPEWKGRDVMVLVKENDKWLIAMDMYAKHVDAEEGVD
ncbi:MAG: hypothetical protein A2V66_05695 [Ignavibacteria bacterium RBG_13_36_8]|nr:MAG: hypothetical protein A2V66_05695 [Ignavibacteria bacterium RBG_13_36_8]